MTPQFEALQDALNAETTVLDDTTSAPDPELIVVFEVAGTIDRFARAVRDLEGLDFLTEFVGEGIEPDDEFFMVDEHGDATDALVTQSLYLVMTNVRAIDELVHLFDRYHDDHDIEFETGLAPLKKPSSTNSTPSGGGEPRIASRRQDSSMPGAKTSKS